MSFMHPIRLALVATVLGATASLAQGTAPNQGVTQPSTPQTPAQPPSADPSIVTDGRPRPDTGGSATSTAPGTTAGTTMPGTANTSPPAAGGDAGAPRPAR